MIENIKKKIPYALMGKYSLSGHIVHFCVTLVAMITLTHEQIRTYIQPGVYIVTSKGVPLYIGATHVGISRALAKTHITVRQIINTRPDVQIDWHPTSTSAEAFALETKLIEELHPQFNAGKRDQYRRWKAAARQKALREAIQQSREPRSQGILTDAQVARISGRVNGRWLVEPPPNLGYNLGE